MENFFSVSKLRSICGALSHLGMIKANAALRLVKEKKSARRIRALERKYRSIIPMSCSISHDVELSSLLIYVVHPTASQYNIC